MKTLQILILLSMCYCTGYSADMSQIVHVIGKNLSSSDVIKQVEKQTGLFIDNRIEDTFAYKQNYDSFVSVSGVFSSLKQYHLECNKTKIRIRDRGHNKFIIEPWLTSRPIKRLRLTKEVKNPVKEDLDLSSLPSKSSESQNKTPMNKMVADIMDSAIEMPKDDLFDNKPKATVASSKGLLNVDIVDGKRNHAVDHNKINKDFKFDDFDMTLNNKVKSTPNHVATKSLSDRIIGLNDRKGVFSAGILGFSGPLAGFLSTPHIPSNFLSDEAWELNIESEMQSGRGQSNVNGALEIYDSEYLALNIEGRKMVYENVEAVVETAFAAHTGDFSLIGAQNQNLGLDISGLKLGLNYFYDAEFNGIKMPIVIRPSLKLPVGQTNNMLNTGNSDYSLHLATNYDIEDYTLKLQLGYTFWGDHSFITSNKSNRGFDALLAFNFKVNQKFNAVTRLYFSESPLKNSNGPSFYSDDIFKVQVGAELNYLDHSFYILGNSGLSDSASDIGIMVHWKTLID
jgi:hypothetical protein